MSAPGLPLPQYSLREEFASSFIHGVGLLLSLAGLALLVVVAARAGDARHVASVAIYGATLVLLMLYEPRGMLGHGSHVWRAVRAGAAHLTGLLGSRRSYAANP